MENKERPSGSLLPEKDTRIQLVVNNSDSEEDTIDLGRVFHNMKVKSRIFAWVLVLCLTVGLCAPLVMYQLNKAPLTVSAVVTLRYDAPNPEYLEAQEEGNKELLKTLEPYAPVSLLVTPDGEPLDLSVVTSAPVLQKALSGMRLSHPVSIENLRGNITVTRVLTEESSRTREALSGLADAKNTEAYNRLEETEMKYQNRFVVTLTNGFSDPRDPDSRVKIYLTDEELRILLNRILDAYNDALVQQYADVRLPADKVSLIDPSAQDLPEVADALGVSMDDLLAYCEKQPESVRAYRSWRTGLSLEDWINAIRTVRSVSIDYLEATVYANGLSSDRETAALTWRYRLRDLKADLAKVEERIANTGTLLKNYRNDEVYVSMQESDGSRSTKVTTAYYNELVAGQQENYAEAAALRIEIAETENKLARLEEASSGGGADLADAGEEAARNVDMAKRLFTGVREHMSELFASPIFTTYSEHSAPQGETENFLKASLKKMIIGAVAGAVVACGLWFLAALLPEFQRKKEDDPPKAEDEGKEAAEA